MQLTRSLVLLGGAFLLLLYIAKTRSTHTIIENSPKFERLPYKHPGLKVDLGGVGLWASPLPMDYDNDGDMDLLVSCNDVPFNGLFLFENSSGDAFPIFEPPVKVSEPIRHIQVSYVNGEPRFLEPGKEFTNFKKEFTQQPDSLFPSDIFSKFHNKIRFNQWKYVDYENDGDLDIVVGIQDGEDYGWDNAFNNQGEWTNGPPLHGYVYLIENINGTYELKDKILAGGQPIDVYGAPSPNFDDYDNDGDLDIICGEFLDRFTWFENVGTREKPKYAAGRFLKNKEGTKNGFGDDSSVSIDWDKDGDVDLIVGDEDGRVAWVENTGAVKNNMPVFESPRYFQQKAEHVKFGALVSPFSIDWDNDGDEDLICGNSAGYIAFIENLDGGNTPRWAAPPKLLKSDNKIIRIQAGENGSIQGPCEAKWGGYTPYR